MSGVKTGTRLDQLLELRRRLDMEIAAERRREALAVRRWETYERPKDDDGMTVDERRRAGTRRSDDATRQRLDQLGVTSLEVKQWAVRAGYLVRMVQGRVAAELVEKYADAHPRA